MKTLILLLFLFGGKIFAQEKIDTLYLHDFPNNLNLKLIYSCNDLCLVDTLAKDVLFLLLEQQKLQQEIFNLDSLKTALNKKREKRSLFIKHLFIF